jgi:copper resistance protein B
MKKPILLAAVVAGAACLALAAPVQAQSDSDHAHPSAPSHKAEHGGQLYGQVLVEQLEYRLQGGKDVMAWDAQAWYGGDYEKIRLKTEGAFKPGDGVEDAEVQLLYSTLVGYYWDLQAGVRHDFRPEPSRSYGVVGLQGLAPGYFEVDVNGFVSEEGDFSARLKAEYDLLITQRLILQPKAEINLAAQDVPELGIGQGLNDIELGLRLRYEFAREFAPYIGVAWHRKLGETASLARREGADVDEFAVLAGVRFWF